VKFATPRARSTFDDVLKEARQAFEQTSDKTYQGPLLADPTEAQQQGRQETIDLANQLEGVGGSTIRLGQRTARGDFLDSSSNQYLQDAIDTAVGQARESVTEEVLPQAQSQAIQQGAYGGDRAQLTEQQILEDFSQEAQDTAARIAYQNYQDERSRQQRAPQLIQQGVGLELTPSQLARQVGARQRADEQARLDEGFRRFQMEQQAPWIGLPQYAQVATGTPTTSTSTVQKTPSESQQVGNYIQAGLGGLSTAAQVEDQTGWISDAAGAVGDLFL
jgi:hypothetical protein